MKRYKGFIRAALFFLLMGWMIPATALGAQEGTEEEVLLKDNLEDGKYTVMVYLWNATMDKESMGDAALNHEALLTVKDGIYQIELTTHPMTVGTINACLETMQIEQLDGTYKDAEITARNNEGDKPSSFSFILPSKEEYINVLIDPKVSIMGQALEARLKIVWSTLAKAADDAVVKEDTTNTVVSTPQPTKKAQESTKKKKTSSSTKKSIKKNTTQAKSSLTEDDLEELVLEDEEEEVQEENAEVEEIPETVQSDGTEIPEQNEIVTIEENSETSEKQSDSGRIDLHAFLPMLVLGAAIILSEILAVITLAAIFLYLKREQESRRDMEGAEEN